TTALTVSLSSKTIEPGSVVLLSVKSTTPLTTLSGRAFARPVRLWMESPLEWKGFAAADLEAKPGAYGVELTGTPATGAAVPGKTMLPVVRKQFETRRLRVGKEFVNPPQAEAERIASEAKRMAALFTQSTPRAWRGPFHLPLPGTATNSFGRLPVLTAEPRGRPPG